MVQQCVSGTWLRVITSLSSHSHSFILRLNIHPLLTHHDRRLSHSQKHSQKRRQQRLSHKGGSLTQVLGPSQSHGRESHSSQPSPLLPLPLLLSLPLPLPRLSPPFLPPHLHWKLLPLQSL